MNAPRAVALVAALFVLALAGVGGAGAASTATTQVVSDTHVSGCAATPPADHADPAGDTDDVIGWADGYWYNESLGIEDATLTSEELERLMARTAARVEALRCHALDEIPPLELVSRDEFRNDTEARTLALYDRERRLFTNAQFATQLLVGQNRDAVNVSIESQASAPVAFYDHNEDYMGFVTDTPDRIEIDEATLAHELAHALQHDTFENYTTVFRQPTSDRFISSLAILEGDASLVEDQYIDNCGENRLPGVPASPREWTDECLFLTPEPPTPPSWGLTLNRAAAYHGSLVEQTYETEGWDGVDALFENMPDSMVEVLDPDEYGEFEPTSVTIENRSTGDWERLAPENPLNTASVPYDVVGQHGLTAMLIAPSFETSTQTNVINFFEFRVAPGEFDYDHPVTDGWQGDRFYAYADSENNTAGVWELAWDDSESATEFADAYEELVAFRGGTPTAEYENAFTFEESEEFDMALGVERANATVRVVMAPTVDDLTAVHSTFDLVSTGENGTDGNETNGNGNETNGNGNQTDQNGSDNSTDDNDSGENETEGADGSGPGFGVAVAVAALVGGLLAARRRAR